MDGDGCSSICLIEYGYTCANEPSDCFICGNGIVDHGEECDDGNRESNDGCSENCMQEEGYYCYVDDHELSECCGDGIRGE